jgi:hypothetical protein
VFHDLANPYDYGVDGGGEFRPYAFVVTLRCSLDLLRAQELSEISRATNQPDGQISKNLSSPRAKTIPVAPSGKSNL